MTIFIYILKIIKGIGFIFILFVVSFLLTSVNYYSKEQKTDNYQEIEIIKNNNFKVLEAKENENVIIELRIVNDVKNEYLIAYCMGYEDIYNKEVNIYVVEENIIVKVEQGRAVLLKK